MIKKTICISNPAYLSLRLNQMVISVKNESGECQEFTRPIEDMGVVVVESLQSTMTSALLSYLCDNNVAVLICDKKHMPSGMLLPLAHNSQHTEKISFQISSSQPLKKQLWQQTVSAKIENQGTLLDFTLNKQIGCMHAWARSVKSGDPDNLEARAANFYWHNIFSEECNFFRGDDDNPVNALLNYGYAVLRAIIARAIVATGLIPSLGIFHSNKYNAYCLADDLMEPYRPFVDMIVISIVNEYGKDVTLTREIKTRLLSLPVIDVRIGNLCRPLMNAATITTASLAKCYSGELRKISYPVISIL